MWKVDLPIPCTNLSSLFFLLFLSFYLRRHKQVGEKGGRNLEGKEEAKVGGAYLSLSHPTVLLLNREITSEKKRGGGRELVKGGQHEWVLPNLTLLFLSPPTLAPRSYMGKRERKRKKGGGPLLRRKEARREKTYLNLPTILQNSSLKFQ